jgi:hypothetical protein
MKLTIRDAVSTLFVVAIAVPYVGYLVRGDMPFIQDPRGMSGTGLVLGLAAFLTAGLFGTGLLSRVELGLALGSLAIGVVALVLAETAAAEVLLAVFMATIVLTWAVKMLDHAESSTSGVLQSWGSVDGKWVGPASRP